MPSLDAVVLAGGRSRRFGADKVSLLLDRVLDGLPPYASVICVGPARVTVRDGVTWVREDPPLAGPLAAVATGVAAGSADLVALLGADMPQVGLAVAALVAAASDAPLDGAVLLDSEGYEQVLASVWHRERLTARLAALSAPSESGDGLGGRPLRLLLDGAGLVQVPDRWGAAHDVDTPDDLV